MRIAIWGTGKFYEKYKKRFSAKHEIITLIDNNALENVRRIDGYPVITPSQIDVNTIDAIVILVKNNEIIREQIISLGLSSDCDIYDYRDVDDLCGEYFNFYDLRKATEKKRLLVFTPGLNSTGAQNMMFHALTVVRNDYEIVVISKNDGELRQLFVDNKVSVLIKEQWQKESKILLSMLDWSDLLFANTIWLSHDLEFIAQCGKPILWWLHESGFHFDVDMESMRHVLNMKNVQPYAVSNIVRERFSPLMDNSSKIKILLFGVDDFATSTSKHEKIVFSMIGHVHYIKGYDIFLRAVDSLPDFYRKRAKFLIVGGGEFDSESRKILNRYEEVSYLGKIENSCISEVYEMSDVVICCSREDSMSVSAVEGFMNQKIVVASDHAGISAYMTNEYDGYVMRNEDVEQLVRIIKTIIDSTEEAMTQMRQHGRRIYENYFTMDSFKDNMKLALKKCLELEDEI